MDGILNILKPPGMTSHDVVGYMRRLLQTKKVGHTGTLDPDVAGVLPICLGKATKVIQYLADTDKKYRAEITFGISTDTQDASGQITNRTDARALNISQVQDIFAQFKGASWQIPPMVSAVKVQGKKLYEYARQGLEIKREPKKIYIYALNIIKVIGLGTPHLKVFFDVHCTKGTYIRSLCADIGEKTGYGAHMSFLLRTVAGSFKINEALTIEEVTELAATGNIQAHLLPIAQAIAHLPKVTVYQGLENKVKSGNRIFAPGVWPIQSDIQPGNRVCLQDSQGNCLAIAIAIADDEDESRIHFQPHKVL